MGDLTHPSRGNVAGQNVCFIHTWYCDSPAEWQEGATGRCPRCRLCRWFHWLQLCPPRAESGVGSSPIPTHTLLLLFSLYSYPSSQHKNLRVVLKPLSPRCQTHSPATPTPPSPPPQTKGVFVQRLVDEVQSVFGAKHAHPLTPGRTLTLTGLRTKITLSCLLCFLLNPLQHMTCVTATDLHWKIWPVEGQGKSPKQESKEGGGWGEIVPVFTDGLFKKFIFLKYLAYFMVL